MLSSAAEIESNASAFERLVAVARERTAARRLDSAAAWARVAAAFATTNPHGALRDVRLEQSLDTISRIALAPAATEPSRPGERRRVLHVLSEGNLIGGHIRMAIRWVASDGASRPSVVVTRPHGESPELTALVRRRDGSTVVLESPSLVERARQLRAVAAAADVVVCHTHADDPVPAIAFGGDYAGAPVVMVNHADHVFWLGVGNLSVLLNLRDIGAEAAVIARGYPEENQFVVPTPLPGISRQHDRADAKRRLGIDASRLVALTLARPVKFAPAPWHPGFVEMVRPALEDAPQVMLVAVGPSGSDPSWRSLEDAFPDRVLVPGFQADPSVHLDAADIYLDSFPFASVTSMLEAAARDVPVVASRRHRGMQRLMSSVGPLDDVVLGPTDVDSYRAGLAELAADPGLRARVGAAGGEAVRRRHGSEAWVASLEQIYDRAYAVAPVRRRLRPTAPPDELAAYAEALIGIEARAPLLWTINFCREGFDAADRRSSLLRTLAVRAAQKATGKGAGHGPSAVSYLVPSGRAA